MSIDRPNRYITGPFEYEGLTFDIKTEHAGFGQAITNRRRKHEHRT